MSDWSAWTRIGYHNRFPVAFYILIGGAFIFGLLRPRKEDRMALGGSEKLRCALEM